MGITTREDVANLLLTLAFTLHEHREKAICQILEEHEVPLSLYWEIKKLIRLWPNYSGHPIYPIKHPHKDPRTAYYSTIDKWSGDYGTERCKLCLWLCDVLKKPTLEIDLNCKSY